ncbi:hypothetical protein [Longimicrobium sp.]|uniref:hypothetical protein n=1 Tax=Longimicrobium sp. TaxID=2029185 RepID=UPI003B3A7432
MTFDEALDHPGPLLAAWDLTTCKGQRTLTLFSLVDSRALPLAHRSVSVDDEDAAAASLRDRGIDVGEYDSRCDFVWLIGVDGVTVWGPHGRVLHASGNTLTLACGRTLARAELARVQAYASDDYLQRGVRTRLRSGDDVELVREVSAVAAADPTYSRNELLYDTAWAGAIASAVATWARIPYENGI